MTTPYGNVRFCRKRADKAGHCSDLGITHMVDDRLDAHRALLGLVPSLYLFGHQPEPAPDRVRHVRDRTEAESAITADIEAARGRQAIRRWR